MCNPILFRLGTFHNEDGFHDVGSLLVGYHWHALDRSVRVGDGCLLQSVRPPITCAQTAILPPL